MSDKLRKKMQDELLAIAKESNASPHEFLIDLGAAYLNICGLVCDAWGFGEDMRSAFFDGLIDALKTSVKEAHERRAKNGAV